MPPDLVITLFGDIHCYSAQDCMCMLQCKPDAKHIEVRICSDGGSVFEGLAIYHALKEHPAHVTTKCYGLAASMASVVFLAGDERIMYPGSMLMIHNPSGIREPILSQVRESLLEIYSASSDLKPTALSKMLDAETYLTAEDSVKAGFATQAPSADEEYGLEPMAKLNIERIPSAPRALVSLVASARKALEGKGNTGMDLKQINLMLGLPETASAEETAAAIEALKGVSSVSSEENVETAIASLHPKVQAKIESLRLSARASEDKAYKDIFSSRPELFTPALEVKARKWPLDVLKEFVASQGTSTQPEPELPETPKAPIAKRGDPKPETIKAYAKATGRTIKQVEELWAKRDALRFPVQFVDSIGAK